MLRVTLCQLLQGQRPCVSMTFLKSQLAIKWNILIIRLNKVEASNCQNFAFMASSGTLTYIDFCHINNFYRIIIYNRASRKYCAKIFFTVAVANVLKSGRVSFCFIVPFTKLASAFNKVNTLSLYIYVVIEEWTKMSHVAPIDKSKKNENVSRFPDMQLIEEWHFLKFPR